MNFVNILNSNDYEEYCDYEFRYFFFNLKINDLGGTLF